MEATGSRQVEQARRLELGLVRVRWFGTALGLFLISQDARLVPSPPRASILMAYAFVAVLAAGNVTVWHLARRLGTPRALARLGLAAFGLDAAVIFGITWAYSFDPRDPTWVVLYALPLEGAIRYQLAGALGAVAVTLWNEIAREYYLAATFTAADPSRFLPPYRFQAANVVFRVGLQTVIALVAGFMARSLARERDRAEEQARRSEEVALREASARRELAAFNTAILTGVAALDLEASLQLMAAAIGRDLAFEALTILLREGDHLLVKGTYGIPRYREPIPIGSGVTGTVASTGRPLIVPDVRLFPGYIEADPEIRSEMAAPMRIGDELIGVVDVESRTPDRFDEHALGLLTRLADQIALVAHSNRLLSRQRETMARLQELDQMKSDFVAITSHELRTPITAIRGFVTTLLRNRDRLSPEQVEAFVATIDRHSQRLARLVDDLLLVSRIEAGSIRLSMEETDLATLLAGAAEAFGPEGRSRIRVSVVPERPTVVVDPHRVDQVLRNLVENALKFSDPSQPVEVSGAVRDGRVEIAVADRGVGISPEDLPRIFDRFHQGERAITRETEGAGLGLYITKRLVEAMGGTIEVSSAPGRGSTFTVTLPAPGGPESPAGGPAGSARPGTGGPASARSVPGMGPGSAEGPSVAAGRPPAGRSAAAGSQVGGQALPERGQPEPERPEQRLVVGQGVARGEVDSLGGQRRAGEDLEEQPGQLG